MSDALKKLRDGSQRTSAGIDRTAEHMHREMQKSNPNATFDQARRRVAEALTRHDRKTGE